MSLVHYRQDLSDGTTWLIRVTTGEGYPRKVEVLTPTGWREDNSVWGTLMDGDADRITSDEAAELEAAQGT